MAITKNQTKGYKRVYFRLCLVQTSINANSNVSLGHLE